MNENNPQPQPWIDPALEARIVAHVVGETSAFEAAELERLLAENPELAIFKRRVEATHSLVGVAVRPENPKIQLSPERRKKLQETIGVPVVVSDKKIRVVGLSHDSWWSSPILIRVAACLVMTTLVLAIFSSVTVFRSSGEKSNSEGFSGESGFVVNMSDAKSARGTTLSGGAEPQVPAAIDLDAGSLVSAGVVTRISPTDFSDKIVILPAGQVPASPANETVEYLGLPQSGPENVATLNEPMSQKAAGNTFASSDAPPQELAKLEEELLNKQTLPSDGRDSTPLPSVAQANQESESGKDREFRENKAKSVADSRPERLAEVQSELLAVAPDSDQAPVTTGNRSGSTAISANSLDALHAYMGGGAEGKTPSSNTTVWDGETSVSGRLIAETTGEKILKDGRDGTPLPSVADADQTLISQANNGVVPRLGDIPLAGEAFRDESQTEAPPSPQTANVINQPVFATREDGKVKFDGFINYGSPIMTVPRFETASQDKAKSVDLASAPEVSTRSGERTSQQVVREFSYPSEFQPPTTPTAFQTTPTNEPDTQKLLREAAEFKDTGRYDLASKRYQQTLREDPYNSTARRGLAEVNAEKAKYYGTAYNETRSRMMLSVDAGWELPVRRFNAGNTTFNQPPVGQKGTAPITKKLNEIIIPRIDLRDVTIEEALKFLKERSVALDSEETDPSKKGINIVQTEPSDKDPQEKITLSLSNISVLEALRYVTEISGKKYKIAPHAVSVVPLVEATTELVTKEYKVPPGFIPVSPAGSISSAAKRYLETVGVTFPAGSIAHFIASSNKLIVRNTPANLDLVDTLVDNQIGRAGSPSPPPSDGSEIRPYQTTELLTAQKPVSTFSLHVSDVSFQLAKDALAKGTMPEPARIRPEEFYNAFDYSDPAPAQGEPVATRIEQTAHPFLQQRNLVRIAVKVAASGRAAGQPLRLTILLDTSGSMGREDRAVSVRQALQTLTTLLGPNDRVTLIGFARTPRLLAEQLPGDQAGKLVEAADRTPSEGGTNLEEALALASEMALKQKLPAAQNRIVLLTDGAANLGNADPVRLARQIEKTRQQGISFDACGVGAVGLNDEILEALTRKGDGRYYFLNKPEDADASFAKQLAGAFRPAAENVKVQVVFNPARVAKYRLIGFQEHLLKREDFRNDTVQAAELSAEEAGVALYQVEPLPEGEGDLGQVFVRFRDPSTGTMVERSWTMPYEANVRAFDQASPSLQLAATAALLAERLQGNTQIDLDALKPVIKNLRSHYPHQACVRELLQMFEQVQR